MSESLLASLESDENPNGILRSFHKKAIEWSQWSQVGTLV